MKTIVLISLLSALCFFRGWGQCSNSIVFNDQSRSVFLPSSNMYYSSSNGGFTWECWFKLNQPLGTEVRPLINSCDAVLFEDLWLGFGWDGGFFNEPPTQLVFRVDGANSAVPVSGGCAYEPVGGFQVGAWYHAAGTMDYTTHTISLYLNGQLVDSHSNNVTPITRIIPTALSCPLVSSGSVTLNGNMDEVKIWSRPLPASEITANYLLCRSGQESHLETYYHCNDGIGSQLVANSSSVGINGNGNIPLPGGTWSVEAAPLTDHSCMPHCDCPELYTGPEQVLVCAGDSVWLSAEPGYPFYSWSSPSGMEASDSSAIQVSPAITTTYVVQATIYGPEMVVNGDFSQGNTGFTNDYTYSSVYSPCDYYVNNQYFTMVDPTMVDHTPTSDNMMMAIDGCSGGEIVWQETFTVVPFANYMFTFWATRAAQVQPIFQTTFTGNTTGPYVASVLPGIPTVSQWMWDEYNGGGGLWNAGNNTTITITVSNLETNGFGNDFAMDDFSLKMQCNGYAEVTVYVNDLPLDLGQDVAICQGTDYVIHAGNDYSGYLWSDGSTADSLVVSAPGTYWVTVQSPCDGTFQTDTIHITTVQVPVLDLGNDFSICYGDTVHFSPVSGFANYSWSGAGLSCMTCANPDIFPVVTTEFSLLATTSNGCSVTDSVMVTIVPLPQVDLGNDVSICSGDTVILGNTVPLNNYNWFPSIAMSCSSCSNPDVYPAVSTTYSLTWVDPTGCEVSDSVRINVSQLPVFDLGNDVSVCAGESVQLNFMAAPAFTSFQWIPANDLSCAACPDPVANPPVTTSYSLQATTAAGCVSTDSILVIVKDDAPTEVHIVVTDATCESPGTVAVEAVGDGSSELQYHLNQPGFSTNPFFGSVAHGSYILMVRNGDTGCPFNEVVVVGGEDNLVYIPNAFTPDGNEFNNVWGIQGNCIDKIFCRIFNRWGEEIATLTDLSQQWDGTFKGEKVPDGVYTYQVEVTYDSEYKELITGSIAVLR